MGGFLSGLFGGGGAASAGGLFGGLGDTLSGTSTDAGILGLGQYKAHGYDIDPAAFNTSPELDARQGAFTDALAQAQGRTGPTMTAAQLSPAERMQAAQLGQTATADTAQIDPSQQAQFRGREMALADQLTAQANGQGPSVAQSQLQTATDRNLAQAMALQASGRGSNNGGMRQAAQAQSQLGADAGRASAELRSQEIMGARSQLGGLLGQGRAADIGLASNQAQLGQQANLANAGFLNNANLAQGSLNQQAAAANQAAGNQFALQQGQFNQQAGINNQDAALRQGAQNDAMAQFYNQGLMGMDLKKMQGRQDLQALQVQQATGLAKANADAYIAASKARGQAASGLGQMLSSGGGLFSGLFKTGSGGGGGGSGGGGGIFGDDYQDIADKQNAQENYVSSDAPGPSQGTPVSEQQSGPTSSVNYSPVPQPSNSDITPASDPNMNLTNPNQRYSFMNYYGR